LEAYISDLQVKTAAKQCSKDKQVEGIATEYPKPLVSDNGTYAPNNSESGVYGFIPCPMNREKQN